MGVAGDTLIARKASPGMPRIKPGGKNRQWDTMLAMMWLIHGPEPLEQRTPERACEKFTVDREKFRTALIEDGVLELQAEQAGIIVPVEQRQVNPLFGSLETALSEKRSQEAQIETLERSRAACLNELEAFEAGETLDYLIALCQNPDADRAKIKEACKAVAGSRARILGELKLLNGELSRLTGLEYSQTVATHLGKSQATKHQELRSPPQREARIVDF